MQSSSSLEEVTISPLLSKLINGSGSLEKWLSGHACGDSLLCGAVRISSDFSGAIKSLLQLHVVCNNGDNGIAAMPYCERIPPVARGSLHYDIDTSAAAHALRPAPLNPCSEVGRASCFDPKPLSSVACIVILLNSDSCHA